MPRAARGGAQLRDSRRRERGRAYATPRLRWSPGGLCPRLKWSRSASPARRAPLEEGNHPFVRLLRGEETRRELDHAFPVAVDQVADLRGGQPFRLREPLW